MISEQSVTKKLTSTVPFISSRSYWTAILLPKMKGALDL